MKQAAFICAAVLVVVPHVAASKPNASVPKRFLETWVDMSVKCDEADVVNETFISTTMIGNEATETKITSVRLIDKNRAEIDTKAFTAPFNRSTRLLTLSGDGKRLTIKFLKGNEPGFPKLSSLKRCPNS